MSLLPIAIFEVLVALLAFWLMRVIYRRDPSPALRSWAAAFLCQAITTACVVHRMWGYEVPVVEATAGLAALLSSIFLIYGCWLYLGRRLSPRWLALPGILMVYNFVARVAGLSFLAQTAPLIAVFGSSTVYVGVALLRDAERTVGSRLAAGGMILYGLHVFDFPVANAYPALLPWGHMVAAFLQIVIATGFVLLHLEAAHRKLAERELMYRALFENAAVGIFIARPDGEILAANDTLAALLGAGDGGRGLIGTNLRSWFAEADDVTSLLDSSNATGLAQAALWRGADGGELTVQLYGRWVQTASGEANLEGVVVDVTRMERLERHIGEVQRAEILGQLAGGIAHDINNVLTVVLANAEVLTRRLPDEGAHLRFVQSISNASLQGAALTRQLLTFTRRHPSEASTFELGPRVGLAAEMLRPTLGDHVALKLALPESGHTVHGDPNLIEQLVVNLIINARDALSAGGTIQVTLRAAAGEADGRTSTAGHVELVVADDGVGIAPEIQDRIFEPFFSTKDETRGTGLGLTIVDRVARQCGGRVDLHSALGVGTTFIVRLPRIDAATSTTAPIERPAASFSPALRVLLVEDRAEVRKVVRELLEAEGFVVCAPDSAKLGLEHIRAGHPIDLLVTDVKMPEVTGQEIARALCERDADARIVFISGFADQSDLLAEFDAQHTRFVSKPFLPGELFDAIAAVVPARLAAPRPARRHQTPVA